MKPPPVLLPPDIAAQAELTRKRKDALTEIGIFLAEAPVYRRHRYTVPLWRTNPDSGQDVMDLPAQIKLYCDHADFGRAQIWETSDPTIRSPLDSRCVNGFLTLHFRCRNCKQSNLTVFLLVAIKPDSGELTKVGQHPALWREADPLVVSSWDKDDVILYRKALTFRNANEGIAALPYLRRIIENHIRDVLDLIEDANARTPISGFSEATLQQARTSHSFSDKLDFAKSYLPSGLVPQGQQNPIGVLYELLSDGLHQRSEDQCVDIFDRCKAAFEYVIRKLTEAKRDDAEYAKALRTLNRT
jgi:hypothetical protein